MRATTRFDKMVRRFAPAALEDENMVRVKICGITTVRDARLATRLGADALGFNFYKRSPRYIRPARAKAIVAALPPFVGAVGVFVNEDPDEVSRICRLCGLHAAQLSGDETPAAVSRVRGVQRIKTIHVESERDVRLCRRYQAEAFLLDARVPGEYGGTGEVFNWELAGAAAEFGPIILAGGLTIENVADAIAVARPYAVDVASSVESAPGKKDRDLMTEFILRAKGMEA